jgi:hypothetical protein
MGSPPLSMVANPEKSPASLAGRSSRGLHPNEPAGSEIQAPHHESAGRPRNRINLLQENPLRIRTRSHVTLLQCGNVLVSTSRY